MFPFQFLPHGGAAAGACSSGPPASLPGAHRAGWRTHSPRAPRHRRTGTHHIHAGCRAAGHGEATVSLPRIYKELAVCAMAMLTPPYCMVLFYEATVLK